MPEITIEVDDATFARLARVAERAGLTVPQQIQRDLKAQTPGLSMKEWFGRIGARGIHSNISREDILATIDELRGP
jgi:hypothetical protein